MNEIWILLLGITVVLLAAMFWFARKSRRDQDAPLPERNEPTLEAAQDADAESRAEEAPEAAEAAAETEAGEVTSETEAPAEAVGAEEPEGAEAAATAEAEEVEAVHEAVEAESPDPEPEPLDASDEAETPAPEPEAPAPASAEPNPEFEQARADFERELKAGHFSKLDVFRAHEQAAEKPGAPRIPRSQFFHQVVDKALEARDEFEGLLCDEDRQRFVTVHSQYLDDVTDETDAEAREALLRDQLKMIPELRPRPAQPPAGD